MKTSTHWFVRYFPKFLLLSIIWQCLAVTALARNGEPYAVVIGTQPTSISTCEGKTATFTVSATGTGTLTYHWQLSTNNGTNWTDITASNTGYSGYNTATLTVSNVTTGMTVTQYRCVIYDSQQATATSAIAGLSVKPLPGVQTVNQAKTVCQSGATALTAVAGTGYTYYWQVSTDNGGSWSTLTEGAPYTNVTTSNLQITGATATMNGYLYRSVTSNGACEVPSAIDTLYVYQPVVTTNASDVSYCAGAIVTLPVQATSPLTLTYQWQVRSSSSAYTDLTDDATYSGSASNTLTINNVTAASDGAGYNIIVTDSKGCFASQNFTLHKYATVALATAPGDTAVCANSRLLLRVTGSNVSSYLWQSDNGTNGATWTTVSTSSIYNQTAVPVTSNGYQYRTVITDVCANSITKQLTLTVRRSGTWLGAKDTKWEEAQNWCGGVPDNTIDVLVPNWPANMPEISDNTLTAYYKSLEIENAARLTISGGVINNMAGPFNLQGTVAYTGVVDQRVFPANHGSLEINGSGSKTLLSDVAIAKNLVLGGSAKLVTDTYIITMKNNSNTIVTAPFANSATSWIVTGKGTAGAANTGLGGLRIEQVDAADGAVLFPVGPTTAAYNPIQVTNTGIIDDFTVAVNDQLIPGAVYGNNIDRTWLLSEATSGGSNVTLAVKWQQLEEETAFDRSIAQIIRSNGSQLVEKTGAAAASGANPYMRAESSFSFSTLTLFSVASNAYILPITVQAFTVQKTGNTGASLNWAVSQDSHAASFTIQRSTDGAHFINIAQLNATDEKTSYQFVDNTLTSGIVYYRVLINGANNETAYTAIQSVNWGSTGLVQLRPSVTNSSSTYVYLTVEQPATYSIQLTDVNGRVFWKQSAAYNKGNYRLPVWLGNVTTGVYYVHINDSKGGAQVLTLIKQ